MATAYIARSLEPVLKRAAREFPAIVLTGPRQSGKTTLLKHIFGDTHAYVSLEPPDVRAAAATDPRSFLEVYAPPVIFDEVQHVPELLPYIKERVDADRSARGRYVMTGSQNLLLLERVTESLVGRAAVLRLLPLSRREADRQPREPLAWENGPRSRDGAAFADLWRRFVRGFYPELVAEPGRDAALWHSSYIQTYLERDVRGLRQIGDLTLFQSFLRVLAARSGQLLNLADMARDLGLSLSTIKHWLSVMEATFQVIILRPYFANIGKRLVKTPKVYFTDVGTLCHLSGIKDVEHAASGPMAGAIFETAVVSEVVKTITHRGEEPEVYFWRTARGSEVDLIVKSADRLIPIEAKTSATPRLEMAAGIRAFRGDTPGPMGPGYVVHPGDVTLPLGGEVTAIPFFEL